MTKQGRADIAPLQQEIRDAGLDVVLAISGENFTYVTDTLILSHQIIPERLCLVIVPRQGVPIPSLGCPYPVRRLSVLERELLAADFLPHHSRNQNINPRLAGLNRIGI